jgi:hypothetical protein
VVLFQQLRGVRTLVWLLSDSFGDMVAVTSSRIATPSSNNNGSNHP